MLSAYNPSIRMHDIGRPTKQWQLAINMLLSKDLIISLINIINIFGRVKTIAHLDITHRRPRAQKAINRLQHKQNEKLSEIILRYAAQSVFMPLRGHEYALFVKPACTPTPSDPIRTRRVSHSRSPAAGRAAPSHE